MIIAPFDKERQYDAFLDKVIENARKGLVNDDDFFIIVGGDAGSGKTRLTFHAYTSFAGEQASIGQIALNQRDFANVINRASTMKENRFACFDEGNVNRREAMTKWNRKTIDLYLNIRGLNILHWWNNPSIEMLDKPFIEERVKAIIYIISKSKKKPRLYYYFTKEGILKLLEEKGNLKGRTIKQFGARYAFYLGWFKDYTGPLLGEYKQMKEDRMLEKVRAYTEEFAPTEKITKSSYAKQVNIDINTASKIINYGVESGLFKEGEHYVLTGTGDVRILPEGVGALDHIRINELYRARYRVKKFIKNSGLNPIVYNIQQGANKNGE